MSVREGRKRCEEKGEDVVHDTHIPLSPASMRSCYEHPVAAMKKQVQQQQEEYNRLSEELATAKGQAARGKAD